MIRRLLIANRGEIAVRIIRTCREMGIDAIAVYSDVDRDAPHVAAADDAVAIGPAPATESYLRADAILAAASGSHVPRPLIEQLAPGGRLVMPVGDPAWTQELVKVTKQESGILKQESLGGVRFVPLIGEEGWDA